MSNEVLYYAEDLPGEVAAALPSFVSGVIGSPAALSGSELVVALDEGERWYFGLAPAGTSAPDVPRAAFSAVVRSGVAVPTRIPDPVSLKLVRVVPGEVARAIVVGIVEHVKANPGAAFATVGWRISDAGVVVMLAPPPEPGEERGKRRRERVVGGETSLGVERHYHVDTNSFAVTRVTGAR
jgi:hypothetical protein